MVLSQSILTISVPLSHAAVSSIKPLKNINFSDPPMLVLSYCSLSPPTCQIIMYLQRFVPVKVGFSLFLFSIFLYYLKHCVKTKTVSQVMNFVSRNLYEACNRTTDRYGL